MVRTSTLIAVIIYVVTAILQGCYWEFSVNSGHAFANFFTPLFAGGILLGVFLLARNELTNSCGNE
nr:MAG TPA: hypothetical protein [Caudoviricetes sp.]